MNRNKKKALVVMFIIMLIILCIAILISGFDLFRPIKIIYSSAILANRENFLTCKKLPTTKEVKDIVLANENNLNKMGITVLEEEEYHDMFGDQKSTKDMMRVGMIEENESFTGADRWNCAGKSDILFMIGGGTGELLKELGKDLLGVPYKIFNY